MKKPFRFMRGELLSGYYMSRFLTCRNVSVIPILDEIIYQAKMRWKLPSEVGAGELPIRPADLAGIGKFAGIYRPAQFGETNSGSFTFTESHIVNGKERSERALYNMDTESLEYIRGENDTYATDITVDATSRKRAGFTPEGMVPVGYVAMGTKLYDDDGTVIPSAILSAPPTDGTPYINYYGDRFLVYEEWFKGQMSMTDEVFKLYYECLMRITYDGASIAEFLYMTELLCDDYIYDIEILQNTHYYIVRYALNKESTLGNKTGRLVTWQFVTTQKFKLFILTERT